MNKRASDHIRVYPDVKIKLKELARELSLIQKEDVKVPEVLRRATNIPNLRDVLLEDAEKKRRMRNG